MLMDVLTLQMNACMSLMYEAKCSGILISKLFPNGIIFHWFEAFIYIRLEQKALSLDTWILSLINRNYMGIWTNSGPQYLTISIELVHFTLLALLTSEVGPYRSYTPRRIEMDSLWSFIICAMSWTRRRSSSFSFWSLEALFSCTAFLIAYPVLPLLTHFPMVANSFSFNNSTLGTFSVLGRFYLIFFVLATKEFSDRSLD